MYPAGEQAVLDRWVAEAGLAEADFLKESRWYHNWGYHWEYYRAIFRFARESGARMFGLNVPRKVVQTARTQGLDALTPEQRALLPERIDTDSEEHRTLFKAFFSADDMHGQLPPEMFEGMFRAQCTWDGAMAHNAIRALRAARGERPIMVVLIGSGHVAYGFGAERQAKLWYDGRIASVIPIPVYDTDKKAPIETARASYASYFWGVPAADRSALPRARPLGARARPGPADGSHPGREGVGRRGRRLRGRRRPDARWTARRSTAKETFTASCPRSAGETRRASRSAAARRSGR